MGKVEKFLQNQVARLSKATVISVGLYLATSLLAVCFAEEPKSGGYSAIQITNKEAIDAAAFAVKIQQKVMQHTNGEPPVKLELTAFEAAEQKIVAGMNYRLRLKVKVDGVEKNAEAVVWWQPWRKSEPYQLMSWSWKEQIDKERPVH